MALVSENLKACGVKISASVCGMITSASGIIYTTQDNVPYNYVLTAKHLFQEDSMTDYDLAKIGDIQIDHCVNGKFCRLERIKKNSVANKLIIFDEDLVIIIVEKNPSLQFRTFMVSDTIEQNDEDFFSWGVFAANMNDLNLFVLVRNDWGSKRLKMPGNYKPEYLPGMSGGGVFLKDRSVLVGIISRYPTHEFQNETVDCVQIDFERINSTLRTHGLKELDTTSSRHKREVKNNVVDIHQAFINEVCLNLEQARKRLAADLSDDWYHDPLRYIDLLNQDYLFEQLAPFLGDVPYEAEEAEKFYVPKKKFTLRLGLLSPFIDRIMYMAVVGTISPRLEAAMNHNVYSARYNRFSDGSLILNGVEQWKKLEYQLFEVAHEKDDTAYRYNCVIVIDLLNFYDNISKRLLCEKIKRVCETDNERRAADLLYQMLCKISEKDVGLPQNSDASSLLASFYLNQVDIFMKEQAPAYYRFMDDIKIFCKDKFEARKILQTFEFELRRCYLAVNSQKTEIFSIVDTEKAELKPGQKRRSDFDIPFDLDMAKISRYRQSDKRQYQNEAFHSAILLLKNNLGQVGDDAAKKLNYAFNTLTFLAVRGLKLDYASADFLDTVKLAAKQLVNKPWLTTEVCKVLNLLPSDLFNKELLSLVSRIVLKTKYNTYAFQTYQLWLLLAKHKSNHERLKSYAVKQIERNDDTSRAAIAGMIIYMCSVNIDYRRVILRKISEGFTHGYFQNRIALVSLRSFRGELIHNEKSHQRSLTRSHEFSHRFKDRDLVFVRGFDEENNDGKDFPEQLYSL